MKTICALVAALVTAPARADDADAEAARAAVAVELALLSLAAPEVSKPDPAPPKPAPRPAPPPGYHVEVHPDGSDWWVQDGHTIGDYLRTQPAPGAAGKTFRPGFDPDHRCDRCGHESAPGTGTWIVRGFNPDGTHSHSCPRCGNVWSH